MAVQSDHIEYFQWIPRRLEGKSRLSQIPCETPDYSVTEQHIPTNFQVKYTRESRSFYCLAMVRRQTEGQDLASGCS